MTTPDDPQPLTWRAEFDQHGEVVERELRLSFDTAGTLTDAKILADAGSGTDTQIIRRFGLATLRVDGQPHVLQPTGTIDLDEASQEFTVGPVSAQFRHTFDRTWQVRCTVRNQSPEPVRIQLGFGVSAGSDAQLMVDACGANGSLAFHHAGEPTVLGYRITRGELELGPTGPRTPEFELAPGASWSLVLSGEWYANQWLLRQRYPAWMPVELELARGDALAINLPDAGLVADGLEVENTAEAQLVSHPAGEGNARVSVHEGSGTTTLQVAWASTLAVQLRRTAEALLRERVLTGVTQAMCLQRAMIDGLVSLDAGFDLLADYTDRHHEDASPLSVLLSTRLASSGLEPDALTWARDGFARITPGPGAGLAWVNFFALLQLDGIEPDLELQTVPLRLAQWALGADSDSQPGAVAEILLLSGLPTHDGASKQARAERRLKLWNEAPGVPWPMASDAELAHAGAVSVLLGIPHQRLQRRLLAQAAERAPLENCAVLAWLSASPGET